MTGITPAEYIRNARELYQGLFTLSRTSIFLMRLQRRSRGILEFVRRAVGPGASLSAKAGIRFTRSGSLLPSLLGSGVPQFADAQPPMLRMPSQQSCSETRSKCSAGAFCRLSAVAPQVATRRLRLLLLLHALTRAEKGIIPLRNHIITAEKVKLYDVYNNKMAFWIQNII